MKELKRQIIDFEPTVIIVGVNSKLQMLPTSSAVYLELVYPDLRYKLDRFLSHRKAMENPPSNHSSYIRNFNKDLHRFTNNESIVGAAYTVVTNKKVVVFACTTNFKRDKLFSTKRPIHNRIREETFIAPLQAMKTLEKVIHRIKKDNKVIFFPYTFFNFNEYIFETDLDTMDNKETSFLNKKVVQLETTGGVSVKKMREMECLIVK